MIKVGSKITIILSKQLKEIKLASLVGMDAVVIENLTDSERKNKGYMVWIADAYQDEYLWFIPSESIKQTI